MIPAFVVMAIYYGQSVQRGQPLEWQRFTAVIIFLLAAVSDGLDGYVARRYNQRSSLGVILDPIADKGLLLSGIITLSISNWSEDPDYGDFPRGFPFSSSRATPLFWSARCSCMYSTDVSR